MRSPAGLLVDPRFGPLSNSGSQRKPCHGNITRSRSWAQEDTRRHDGRRNRVQEGTGGYGTREDTTYAGFGTGRPQSEILTAKLTAILSDVGNRQRMSADAD